MTSYAVTATREAGWWSLVARNVGNREVASQVRRLGQADQAIREAIALVLDVDGQSFGIEIVPELSDTVSEETMELLDVRQRLKQLSRRSRLLTAGAVAELRAAGLPVPDWPIPSRLRSSLHLRCIELSHK